MRLTPFFTQHNNNSQKQQGETSSKKTSIQILEEKLSQEYSVDIFIILCDKKHSSGTIKNESIVLRLSNRLNKSTQEKHALDLSYKLYKKLQSNPKRSNQRTLRMNQFKGVIERGYFLVDNTIVYINFNTTKATVKKDKHNTTKIRENAAFDNKIHETNANKNSITISIPRFNYSDLNTKTLHSIEKKVAKILCQEFNNYLISKVNELNIQTLNSNLNTIYFDYTSSKWGHCSAKNDIMIHISLLNAPKFVFEYVIYHELAHTIVKNHSAQYWSVCNSLTDDTKRAKQFLRNTPPILWNI